MSKHDPGEGMGKALQGEKMDGRCKSPEKNGCVFKDLKGACIVCGSKRAGYLRWGGDVHDPHPHSMPGSCFMSLCSCHPSLLADTSRTWVIKSRFTPKEGIFATAGSSNEWWTTAERVSLFLGSHLAWIITRAPSQSSLQGIYWQAMRRWFCAWRRLWELSGFGKRLFKQKREAEELSSQKINVFRSTQLTWEYNILVRQRQNVPLQNSVCPGISSRVKIQPWHILALTCFFCET